MFEHWDSFYLLVGGAAGALIGLLFIVATLTKGIDSSSALRGGSVYISPVVFQLGLVLVVSALAAAPGLADSACGLSILACGFAGLIASGRVIFHLKTNEAFNSAHWTDIWWYGAGAFVADAALAASAAAVWFATPLYAARGVAVSLVLILLVAIRNAWDLVTWISAKSQGQQAS